MATKEKSRTKTEKVTVEEPVEEPVPVDTGRAERIRQQEEAEKSAQEIVREHHMSPGSFK